MNFNENVDRDFVDAILESSHWQKAKIEVRKRETVNEASEEGEVGTIPEYAEGIANEYEEPTTVKEGEWDGTKENLSFTLDDLQVVLDNLADEDLMEHAMNMLDIFDVAYETLNEDEDEEDDEEDDEDLGEDESRGYPEKEIEGNTKEARKEAKKRSRKK